MAEIFRKEGPKVAIGVYDAISATIAKGSSDYLFLSGLGLAASQYGLPDIGLVTWEGMADFTSRIRAIAPNHKLIVDVDDGYGDAEVAMLSSRAMERAGASAIVLEDQKRPKKCGHLTGKELIPASEYVKKLVRIKSGTGIPVIARTDSEILEDAIKRVRTYAQNGADAILVDGLRSLRDICSIREGVESGIPIVVNLITGGKTPIVDADLEMLKKEVSLYIFSIPCLSAAVTGVSELVKGFSDDGFFNTLRDQRCTLNTVQGLLENNI